MQDAVSAIAYEVTFIFQQCKIGFEDLGEALSLLIGHDHIVPAVQHVARRLVCCAGTLPVIPMAPEEEGRVDRGVSRSQILHVTDRSGEYQDIMGILSCLQCRACSQRIAMDDQFFIWRHFALYAGVGAGDRGSDGGFCWSSLKAIETGILQRIDIPAVVWVEKR